MPYFVGIDEAGRGSLAGPVALAAVKIRVSSRRQLYTLFRHCLDSKRLSESRRWAWMEKILEAKKEGLLDFAVCFSEARTIDRHGLSVALKRPLSRCLERLSVHPFRDQILLDGALFAPVKFRFQKTIIRGDESEKIITLASVVAKTSRDRRMITLAKRFPGYGFDQHKGYGVFIHRKALVRLGPCPAHRKSFLKTIYREN